MGREVRRVPENWEHPTNNNGNHIPMFEYSYPDWEEEDKTHIQMYENTTEGTPISPVFDNAEDLAQWLVDNKARSFGSATATFDQWMNTIKAGYAPSMVVKNGQSMSGVEFM